MMFRGSSDPKFVEDWIGYIERTFRVMKWTNEEKVLLDTSSVEGEAQLWWEAKEHQIVPEDM